jgi:hypothetical protein
MLTRARRGRAPPAAWSDAGPRDHPRGSSETAALAAGPIILVSQRSEAHLSPRELHHFRDACDGQPLCGGAFHEPHRAKVRGVPLCAECVRRLLLQARGSDPGALASSARRR